jgi:hypothetical protein
VFCWNKEEEYFDSIISILNHWVNDYWGDFFLISESILREEDYIINEESSKFIQVFNEEKQSRMKKLDEFRNYFNCYLIYLFMHCGIVCCHSIVLSSFLYSRQIKNLFLKNLIFTCNRSKGLIITNNKLIEAIIILFLLSFIAQSSKCGIFIFFVS